ncbi:hypothetical protein FACS1894206_06450 [Deltaproteobacteria bacterium]|nr:hypothetical protein FACS1894206_06450 [Deltaproteobacteria bacterium]
MATEHAKESEKNRKKSPGLRRSEYWSSVLVLVFVAGFFITVAALCYGIITMPPQPNKGIPTLAFPWVGWFASILVTAAVILGFAQFLAGKNSAAGELSGEGAANQDDSDWARQLPQRARRAYRIIKDAPLFMVCFALIALGATLLLIDGALNFLAEIFSALLPYAPYFIGSLTIFVVAVAALLAWFRYAHNRLAAEYAFRREVLEKTGVILLDDRGKALLPQGNSPSEYKVAFVNKTKALPGATSDGFIEVAPAEQLPETEK